MKKYPNIAVAADKILLPHNVDIATWSTIACDQWTQDKDYWERVTRITCGVPSTRHITLPEIFLSSPDKDSMIADIKKTMREYLDGGIFDSYEGFIYTRRKLDNGKVRRGLILSIDLEMYDYKGEVRAAGTKEILIRATEATIKERIPPRLEIRRGAALEAPHIMLLVDDKKDRLFTFLDGEVRRGAALIYSGTLMEGAGSLEGFEIKETDSVGKILGEIKDEIKDKGESDFLFAVGDGNHSLATAKALWEESDKKNERLRYALVEVVNLNDEALGVEAIHRVLFGIKDNGFIDYIKKVYGAGEVFGTFDELSTAVRARHSAFGIANETGGFYLFDTGEGALTVSLVTPLIDDYLKKDPGCKIDYIHNDSALKDLVNKGATGVLLPLIDKGALFPTISKGGVLPRKSFSLGEANQKRFYTEVRAL